MCAAVPVTWLTNINQVRLVRCDQLGKFNAGGEEGKPQQEQERLPMLMNPRPKFRSFGFMEYSLAIYVNNARPEVRN
jgi:hypothetical protein